MIFIQIFTIIQRPIKVLRQHVFIKGLTSQPSRRISARKILIRPAGSVEISSGRHVVNFSFHGEVHGFAVLAIVLQERSGRVRLENDGRWAFGEGDGRCGAKTVVGEEKEEGEEDEVDGCCDGCPGRRL